MQELYGMNHSGFLLLENRSDAARMKMLISIIIQPSHGTPKMDAETRIHCGLLKMDE
jgi:hypothetical protein